MNSNFVISKAFLIVFFINNFFTRKCRTPGEQTERHTVLSVEIDGWVKKLDLVQYRHATVSVFWIIPLFQWYSTLVCGFLFATYFAIRCRKYLEITVHCWLFKYIYSHSLFSHLKKMKSIINNICDFGIVKLQIALE